MKVLQSLTKAEKLILVLLLFAAILNCFETLDGTAQASYIRSLSDGSWGISANSSFLLFWIVPAFVFSCFSRKGLRVTGTVFGGMTVGTQLLAAPLMTFMADVMGQFGAARREYGLSVIGWICVGIDVAAFVLQICCIKRRFHSAPVMGQIPTYEEVLLGFEIPTPYENPENNDSEEMTL